MSVDQGAWDSNAVILSMRFMICGAVFGISARSAGLTEQIWRRSLRTDFLASSLCPPAAVFGAQKGEVAVRAAEEAHHRAVSAKKKDRESVAFRDWKCMRALACALHHQTRRYLARSEDCHGVRHQIAPLGGQKQISSPL